MNNQEKQELNEKLARYLGLKDIQVLLDHAGKVTKIQFENPEHCQLYMIIEPFTDSLDACFKWLVPKLDYFCLTTEDKGGFYADVSIGEEYAEYFKAETPALAICLAIEELIDRKVME